MHPITIVSLGPGSRDHLTLGTLNALKKAPLVILRTALCDAADYLSESGIAFTVLDDLHEACEDFDELIEACCARVMKAAAEQPVCYAVLDAASDATVRALIRQTPCTVLPGMPLSAPLTGAYPSSDLLIQCADGLSVTDTQHDLLITELDNFSLASECKLRLLSHYHPDTPVLFFPPSEEPVRAYVSIPLEDLDRQRKYNHTCAVLIPAQSLSEKKRFDFFDLQRIMALLRSPSGCPWDREQTHTSLRPYLIEESYEVAAAIDEDDPDHLADELGDVMLQIAFHADIAKATGEFEMSDVATYICEKMIRRHPHVFADTRCATPEEVSVNWDQIKREERGEKRLSENLLAIAQGMEPMLRASKARKKAAAAGLDETDPAALLRSVRDTAGALLDSGMPFTPDAAGQLLFDLTDLCRRAGIDPAFALTQATNRFIRQFERMENVVISQGKSLQHLTKDEIIVYWYSCSETESSHH